MNNVKHIEDSIADLRKQLQHHSLYDRLKDIKDVQLFMENHVFAVWDFMSLLKALQRHITSVNTPWVPYENPKLTRFVNEIVVAEESDISELNEPQSHFQMYVDAMIQIGADVAPIEHFITAIRAENSVRSALKKVSINAGVVNFVNHTFSVIETNEPHKIASAFTFGREDVIPDMFIQILDRFDEQNTKYTKMRYYLQRHIELDGDDHGPLSLKMVEELCGDDSQKWKDVEQVAKASLEHRVQLWNAIDSLI